MEKTQRHLTFDEFEGILYGNDPRFVGTYITDTDHRWYDDWLLVLFEDGTYWGVPYEQAKQSDIEHEMFLDYKKIYAYPAEPYEIRKVSYRLIG